MPRATMSPGTACRRIGAYEPNPLTLTPGYFAVIAGCGLATTSQLAGPAEHVRRGQTDGLRGKHAV
jgi:hypothetical protein